MKQKERRFEILKVKLHKNFENTEVLDAFFERFYKEIDQNEIIYSLLRYLEQQKHAFYIDIRSRKVQFSAESKISRELEDMGIFYKFIIWSSETIRDLARQIVRVKCTDESYTMCLNECYRIFLNWVAVHEHKNEKKTLSKQNFSNHFQELGFQIKKSDCLDKTNGRKMVLVIKHKDGICEKFFKQRYQLNVDCAFNAAIRFKIDNFHEGIVW